MLLRAGALSLALLLASRLLGVVRESAQAAAFGTSALADVAVLVLTLPDWIASVLASGALAYVLLPAWAGQTPAQVAALQRRVALALLALGAVLALLLALGRAPVLAVLAGGLPPAWRPAALQGLWWSAAALPLALLAGLWVTRAQHERDFTGMYGANLVVNAVLIAAIAAAGLAGGAALPVLGAGLVAAMAVRLAWLRWRLGAAARRQAEEPPPAPPRVAAASAAPAGWTWAVLAAALPLALPVAARSWASQGGEGALAAFAYAWKLVELPAILAIQLVASLAFPAIARAYADDPAGGQARAPVRQAFLLAWALGCAAVAGLLIAAPALASLLFGWGRMDPGGLARVADWARAGAWGLLPQAVTAVALTVLASRRRLAAAVAGQLLALGLVVAAGAAGLRDGLDLMHALNAAQALVALACLAGLGAAARALPWAGCAWSLAGLLACLPVLWLGQAWLAAAGPLAGVAAGGLAAAAVLGLALLRGPELRAALRR